MKKKKTVDAAQEFLRVFWELREVLFSYGGATEELQLRRRWQERQLTIAPAVPVYRYMVETRSVP
jgi:hypothetical protein